MGIWRHDRVLITVLAAFLFCYFANAAFAISSGAGTTTAEFLRIPIAPHSVALGGTYATSEDILALGSQPAALALSNMNVIGFQHNFWITGINQDYLAISLKSRLGRFSVYGNTMGDGNIQRTLENPNGSFAGFNGFYGFRDGAIGINYSNALNRNIGYGLTLKYIASRIDDVSTSTVAGDIGVMWVDNRFSAGASIVNMGRGMTYIRERSPLPTAYRAGMKYGLLPQLDVMYDVLNDRGGTSNHVGAEYRMGMLAIRAGYNSRTNENVNRGFTTGLGLHIDALQIDYSYAPYGVLGSTHNVGLTYSWGKPNDRADTAVADITTTPTVRTLKTNEPAMPRPLRSRL